MPIKILKIFLIIDVVFLNVVAIHVLIRSNSTVVQQQIFDPTQDVQTVNIDRCGSDCQTEIKSQLAKIVIPNGIQVVAPSPVSTIVPTSGVNRKKVKKEEILTIPGSGQISSTDWSDISSTNFYFDTRDYPGIQEVYFEANINLVNGNGAAYVRLYDSTNNIAVNGSENNTDSQSAVWTKSQKVYFWAGKNLIRVQARSLTADTAVYNQGRLRIVTEN